MKGLEESTPKERKKGRSREAQRIADRERMRARRAEMAEDAVVHDTDDRPLSKAERINLGLADIHSIALPGVRYSYDEIANFCGCSDAAIQLIEQTIIHEFRRRLWLYLDAGLRDLVTGLFEDRSPAHFSSDNTPRTLR
jgi:hypothetical protein